MKKYQVYGISLLGLLFSSCNDGFLDKYPETTITGETFFTNTTDLETYTNTFYEDLSVPIDDVLSDNISIYGEKNELQDLMVKTLTPETIDEWNWEDIRKYNYLLEHVHKTKGEVDKINHFIGITRMFRAIDYYNKVKRYNDVPWYSRTLNVDDTDLLYKPQDQRILVVDSVMADLAYAAEHVEEGSSKTRITRAAALATQARIALHEGTFRKYHTELNLSDANHFLEVAVEACEKILNMSAFSIHPDYKELFSSSDLSKNPEIILYRDYDLDKMAFNNTYTVFDKTYGLSQNFIDSYLYLDENGIAKPFTSLPDYRTKSYVDNFKNRDPRLKATVCYPGYIKGGYTQPHLIVPDRGGYIQIKYAPTSLDQWTYYSSYIDIPQIRLAEVYLIYAEAKAELGLLTQTDLDKTVNHLRERVGMPVINLANANSNIDPVLEISYPNVSGKNKGLIYELRRERRVELACEGFRYDDINRWSVGKLFAQKMEGFYVPALGPIDVTGDDIPDIAILQRPADKMTLSEEYQTTLAFYFLEDDKGVKNSFYLSEGNKGHIMFEAQQTLVREFVEPKHYYRPISLEDKKVNPNLKETIFW